MDAREVSTTPSTASMLRFDRVERAAHWTIALLFIVLILTAIPLLFGSFFGLVLPRFRVERIHLWAGLALPLPLVVSLVGPWGRRLRNDFKRFNYWRRDEVRWLRSLGDTALRAEKFNPGQKLNAIFVGASILLMLATGSMLQWFGLFSISEREGATFVHDSLALVIVVVIVGHIYMALTHPGSLRSMITGTVSRQWASNHAPTWLEELDERSNR